MPSILDIAPYPWHDRLAVQLHKLLYNSIPRPSRAVVVAAAAGIDTGLINSEQAAFDVWMEILQLAANSQKLRALAETLAADPNVAVVHPFLQTMLKDQIPPIDRDGTTAAGKPAFLKQDDTVLEPEALLFHDDLTLSTGRLPWLIEVLRTLVTLSPAICRLEVARGSESQSGTAVRIKKDLLLTNWHVLTFADNVAAAVTAEFRYEADGEGKALTPIVVPCDAASIRGEKADDWAVVRTAGELPDTIPVLDLAHGADTIVGALAFVIQHPAGARKRVAYVRNQITYVDERVVQYLSDTQVGSSGSPVFDDRGRLIALHHAGGRPQEVAGRMPIKKNEGIRIGRISAALKTMNL